MTVLEAPKAQETLELHWPLVADFLTRFIREELAWRGYEKAIVAVSGGVDSATTLALAVRALGPKGVHALFLPHRESSPLSREHAHLVAEAFGVALEEVDITPMVEGYAAQTPDLTPHRKGNLMARARMMVLFDKSQAYGALPLGTGNKTERLFGYFTWHGDDTPPVNPLGDLYKTQVWALARFLGVPEAVVAKAPTADLIPGQTDEADLGVRYLRADVILEHYLKGYPDAYLLGLGYTEGEIRRVKDGVNRTHWKRALPTVALLSSTAIGEFYLRPLDYRP
ncbi:NAD+ synthase [Thermus thermamylovorans]|uniref:NH(3)-dependent NAD(+) synthetase n=1 Tax=Thermus thermamylovorans TaxID=2509362 RepID=A0A4Q9AXM6_9DEIN|nr:NAD+ synthase [Thermus thermamylovorans]TBH15914.1 NAD+ synthase [Thermus thermamylovorans]